MKSKFITAESLSEAIQSAGLDAPNVIEPGKVCRFPGLRNPASTHATNLSAQAQSNRFRPHDKSVEGCPSLADIPGQQGGLAR